LAFNELHGVISQKTNILHCYENFKPNTRLMFFPQIKTYAKEGKIVAVRSKDRLA
jgi:hypothetical protein